LAAGKAQHGRDDCAGGASRRAERTATLRRAGLIAALLFSAGTAFSQEGVERTFTLEESVRTALANNPGLLAVRTDVRISEQRVWEARSSFLPKVDLQMNGSRYNSSQPTVVSPDLGTIFLRPSRNGDPDSFYAARLGLRQVLYNGGRLGDNLRLAKAALEQSRLREEDLRRQVIQNAVKSFYDMLLAREQKALAEESSRQVDAVLERTPAWAEGARFVWEALQGRFRRNLAERRRSEEKARLDFLNTLGLELYTLMDVRGELASSPVGLELPKLLAWAQQSRLEIRAVEFQREMDELAVNLSKAERFPVVALGGAYEYDDPTFPLRTRIWHATLNVSLPIFDGFSSRARIRQARYQAEQNRLMRGQLEDKIETEVRDAFAEVTYWQSEMSLRRDEMSRARRAVKDLSGSKNINDRASAESWALEAGQAYWESVHGHLVALARLENSVGRSLEK
jgi:outer membrane protein